MKEVRFHGRGGQGAVTAARILASAIFEEGTNNIQAFPAFGMERRGAPVRAFLRFSADEPIPIRTYVYTPDYVVVLDPTLFETVNVNILDGLKRDGLVIINTGEHPSKFRIPSGKIAVVDATSIALKILGRPIMNTPMIGAFAAATQEVSLSAVIEAINEKFPKRLAERNVQAAKIGYQETRVYNST